MAFLENLSQIFVPSKKKPKKGGVSSSPTFREGSRQTLAAPAYRDHLIDVGNYRLLNDSKQVLTLLFKNDPDISAALYSYLTISDTKYVAFAKNSQGELDPKGQSLLNQLLFKLTRRTDYSAGFERKTGIHALFEELKYNVLLHGAVCAELVFDKKLSPSEIRVVDPGSIEWEEPQNGVYKPVQTVQGQTEPVSLDIPSFFFNYYRRNPSEVYNSSVFVSAINTVVARATVINDLYRIMKVTGYPRITLEVVEDIARKNAPLDVKEDPVALQAWLQTILTSQASSFAETEPDQVYAHFDSLKPGVMNERNPAATLQIQELIETLSAQNQAALKVMPTVVGRGSSGVNTASSEARLFALAADSLNKPVSELLQDMLTLALRTMGYDGYVDFWFEKVELRPEMELEPQKTMRQSRLLNELSLGLITDEEYHFKMHRRLPAKGTEKISGTRFQDRGSVEVDSISPNSDPLGRSLAPEGSDMAESNEVNSGE